MEKKKKTTVKVSTKNKITPMSELTSRLQGLAHLGSTLALLSWDQEVNMPERGSERRAETIAHLSGMTHDHFVAIDHDGLLTQLKQKLDKKELSPKEAVIVAETWRSFEREQKLPPEFVRELAETLSRAQVVWAAARQANNFKLFKPWLEKVVELKRREAQLVGYQNEPYDALLDQYEPKMRTSEMVVILNDLKDFLIPFIQKIKRSKVRIDPKLIKGEYARQKQEEFGNLIVEKMGFSYQAGRVDASTHPFTTEFHSEDVRFTVRYDHTHPGRALFSYLHEGGHALYEQGLEQRHFGTPLGQAVSLGIHESQSRLWENIVGRSLSFWKYFYPKLQKQFPQALAKISLNQFYQVTNHVQPSLVRVDADEVTYNLHIILRFEIERELLNGAIRVADLPKIWNQRMEEYLGVTVPNDSLGVLQDVHWSCGLFGYFPTYSLGNLYSAQFWSQAKKDITGLSSKISRGDLLSLREWLRSKIHLHGQTYSASALIKKVTGEELTSKYFINYLRQKYGELYQLD